MWWVGAGGTHRSGAVMNAWGMERRGGAGVARGLVEGGRRGTEGRGGSSQRCAIQGG